MPTFRVTSPDGQQFDVNAPDGATQEQAMAFAQQHLAPVVKQKTLAQMDPNSDEFKQRQASLNSYSTDAQQPQVTGSFGGNAVAGFGKAFVDTGRGLQQIAAPVLDRIAPVQRTTADLVTGRDVSRVAQLQAEADEAKQIDQPLMKTAGGFVGNVAGQGAQAVAAGGVLGATTKGALLLNAARTASPYIAPAIGGAVQGFVQPVGSDDSRLLNTGIGAAGGAIGQGVANGVGRLAQGASDTIAPAVKDLADRASALGIKVRADQLVNSKPANALSAALDYIPFSGKGASLSKQDTALQTAISRTVGQNTDNLTVAIPAARKALGSEFDRVLSGNQVKADNGLQNDLANILTNARGELGDAQYGQISNNVNALLDKVKPGDVIDGRAAYNVKKTLDRVADSQDTSVAHYAEETRNALMSALNRSLPADEAKAFQTVRQQYGNMLSLEKLTPAGAEGGITAARLAQAKSRLHGDDLKELADISAQFIKPRIGDSGTAQRLGAMGAIGGVGAANPAAAIGAIATGRALNSAMGSNALRQYLQNGSGAVRAAVPYANALLPATGEGLALSSYANGNGR